jgi:hypothetical protein
MKSKITIELSDTIPDQSQAKIEKYLLSHLEVMMKIYEIKGEVIEYDYTEVEEFE